MSGYRPCKVKNGSSSRGRFENKSHVQVFVIYTILVFRIDKRYTLVGGNRAPPLTNFYKKTS